jgi:hypothetical protein
MPLPADSLTLLGIPRVFLRPASRDSKVFNPVASEGKMKKILRGLLIAAALLLTAQTSKVLTNQDVLDMVSAKLSDSVIIAAIHKSTCKFSTDPKDLIALKKAGVSDAVMQAMTEAGVPATPAPAGSAQTGASPSAPMTFRGPAGTMTVTQDDVTYDGSTFKVTSVNGIPQNVVEMKPGGQAIGSAIMPNGRIITYPASNDAHYADRIKAVLKIHAAGPAAANPTAASQGNTSVPAGTPSTKAAAAPASSGDSSAAAGNQPDLQNYEGSLGSLGDAKILLPGSSIQTPDGSLSNASDSHRVIVYFSATREKVSFSSGKSSDHKDDVVVWAGNFGSARSARMPAYAPGGAQATPQYTEYLIHFTGGNSNLKHMFEGSLKSQTVDRAKPGASKIGTDSSAHTASFTISTVDANGHVQEYLASRQVDDWMNTTASSRGLGVDRGAARAAGLVVVADQALVDQGKDNADLQRVKKDYGIGEALKNDLRYYAFGAGGLDKPGAQEKRDQRIDATAGALGTTSPSAAPPQ